MDKPWKIIYLGFFFLLPIKSDTASGVIRYPFESLGRFIEPVSPSFGLHKLMSESNRRALYGLVASLLLSTPGVLMRNKTAALSLPLMALLGSSAYQYLNQNRMLPPVPESSNDEHTKPLEQQRTEIKQDLQAITQVETAQSSKVGLSKANDRPLKSREQQQITDPDLLRMWSAQTAYEVLGVSSNATQKEIKKAFNRLSRKFHEDKSRQQNQDEKLKKEVEMLEFNPSGINDAYAVLEDQKIRSIYDNQGWNGARNVLQNPESPESDEITKEVLDYAPHIIAMGQNYMKVITYFTLDNKIELTAADKKFIEAEVEKTVDIVSDLVLFFRKHGIKLQWDFGGGVIGLAESIKKELSKGDNRLQILEVWLGDLKKNGYVKKSADRILDQLFPSLADEPSQREQEADGMSDID